MADLRDTALGFVKEQGWAVFRLRISHDEETCDGGTANCKKIDFLRTGWLEASSNDVDVVDGWDWSEVNAYGIDCGKSHLVVVDQDPGDTWPFGGTRVHSTGRGKHYFYEDLIGLRNRTGVAPWGVDVRGVGGVSIGPGSWHPHGVYAVLVDVPVAQPPPELINVAKRREKAEQQGEVVPLAASRARDRLEGVYARMAATPDGNRNDMLNKLAGTAAGIWIRVDEDDRLCDLDEDTIRARLLESIPNDGDPEKSEKSIESGWAHGVGHPVPDDEPVKELVGHVVDVTNSAEALTWLKAEVGRGGLAGVFRRGWELVHTPRIGEDGYVPPTDERDDDGPAQVRRIPPLELSARVDANYTVVKVDRNGATQKLFPTDVAARAASAPDLLSRVKDLRSTTHTPVVRADGTVLDEPGYDVSSGLLYLPDLSLDVPKVSDRPTRDEVAEAGKLLLAMVADFPFITAHDLANYLGALLTPLLRPLVPPPYKLIVIGAPQRGSGKTLLAQNMREIHGGVFRAEFPTNEEERRKVITTTLDATTGPVVQFDNVTGVLKSSVLDGLLTSAVWSDRWLGGNTLVTLRNDRLWVVTGNNVHIGGDLERRTLWVTINADMEHPETRDNFSIPHLEKWVREHRGELLHALLTLIRAWVVAGKPMGRPPTSDGFGHWIAVLRGVLDNAEIGGVVGHADSVRRASDPEDDDWATFLVATRRVFGPEQWTAKDVISAVGYGDKSIAEDELPGDIAEKLHRSGGAAKSLGRWLTFRDRRWAGGLSVQGTSGGGDRARRWRVMEIGEIK